MDCEAVWCTLKIDTELLLIGFIYRPPQSDREKSKQKNQLDPTFGNNILDLILSDGNIGTPHKNNGTPHKNNGTPHKKSKKTHKNFNNFFKKLRNIYFLDYY